MQVDYCNMKPYSKQQYYSTVHIIYLIAYLSSNSHCRAMIENMVHNNGPYLIRNVSMSLFSSTSSSILPSYPTPLLLNSWPCLFPCCSPNVRFVSVVRGMYQCICNLFKSMRNCFYVQKWLDDVEVEQLVLRISSVIWEMHQNDLRKSCKLLWKLWNSCFGPPTSNISW